MAIEEDTESCGSRPVVLVQSPQGNSSRHHKQKLEAYNEVLSRIQDLNCEEANLLGFDDQLWLHFNRLPSRSLSLSLSLSRSLALAFSLFCFFIFILFFNVTMNFDYY
jgi:hypothetical protein